MTTAERKRPENEIYFTLKAYSRGTGKLQFDLDFNVPFSTSAVFQQPTTHISQENVARLGNIFNHILEIYRFIEDPENYGDKPKSTGSRLDQQRLLKQLRDVSGGKISRIIFNENSDPEINVSYSGSASGNGDQRPPGSN